LIIVPATASVLLILNLVHLWCSILGIFSDMCLTTSGPHILSTCCTWAQASFASPLALM
jgi:hypothetical protein